MVLRGLQSSPRGSIRQRDVLWAYRNTGRIPYALNTKGDSIIETDANSSTTASSWRVPEAPSTGDRTTGRPLQQRYRPVAENHQRKGRHQSQVRHYCLWHNRGSDAYSGIRGPGGAARQEAALQQEGVQVGHGSMGERTIDFGTYGWFPNHLPSEDADDED